MSPYCPGPALKLLHSKKTLLAILVLALIAIPVAFFFLSYHSVNGTHVELVKVFRSTGPSSAIFHVEAHVWSWAGSIDTNVNALSFRLDVDGFHLGTYDAPGGSFQTRRYLSFNLRFQTSDYDVARTVGQSDSDNIVITMTAIVNAGMYGQFITRQDSAVWKWTS